MGKENAAYIYNGVLFSQRKEWYLSICNNMNGPWGHYTKWNQSDKERQILYDLTYIWNLSKNKQTKNKLIEHTGGCQRQGVGEVGKTGEGGQKVQTSSYIGDVMYNMVTIVNNTVLNIWESSRENILKVLITHTHTKF